ncbi:MAG: isoprenylcysteine carboxylmethyltransferase family protein [Candidatus Bathyarchaeota archaeon]|nr:isoprenylcysteine carboxylmethyltransferase family protein [Candidatus Bathyarchaeota archaeon]
MTIIPAFEIGLWNAWILLIPMLIISFSDMAATASRESGKEGDFQLTKKENRIANAFFLPMIISWVYAIFLPLQLGTIWLYIGLIIFLFGIVFTITAILTFANSSKDKVITTGLFRFTRNPTYIGIIIMQTGIGIACTSWLYLLLTVVLIIMFNTVLPSEERYLLYRFGDDYQKYKNRTPRWIGIHKSEKKQS